MSDSILSPVSKLSFITTMLQKVRSVPAPAPIAPPMKSTASFICSADMVLVPWSSSDAVRCASPSFSRGSDDVPARTSSRIVTAGCSWCMTTTTCRPLGRVWIS